MLLGVQQMFTAIISSALLRLVDYDIRIYVLPFNYVAFLISKLILFMIIRKFTPEFVLESAVEGKELHLIGLNSAGYELFRFKVDESALQKSR